MNITKTYTPKLSHIQSQWHVFDATDKVLGRLATEVAILLQGKNKPIFARHIITGDYVIVVNASKIRVTGNKMEQKTYRHHSSYPGGLRETSMAKVQANHPDRIIRDAVQGMLPKNTLGRQMLSRLKIYAGETHPHGAQIKDLAIVEAEARPARRARPTRSEILENEQPPADSQVQEPPVQQEVQPQETVAEESTEDKAER